MGSRTRFFHRLERRQANFQQLALEGDLVVRLRWDGQGAAGFEPLAAELGSAMQKKQHLKLALVGAVDRRRPLARSDHLCAG